MNPEDVVTVGRAVATNGPDPTMLGFIIGLGIALITLVSWLIRTFARQQERTINEAQAENRAQREAHAKAQKEQSDLFERSLQRIVDSNNENMSKIAGQIDDMNGRLTHIEANLTVRVQPGKPEAGASIEAEVEIEGPPPKARPRRRRA